MSPERRRKRARNRMIAVCMLMAFILYLDRICLAEIVKTVSFRSDVALTQEQIGTVLGVFFFSYALFQVPAGWAADRLGCRPALTAYIILWSLFTALTGLMSTFATLVAMRLLCGAAEAGAYPTCNALIRRWCPVAERARASALVSFAGRTGGALAPFLTAWMVVSIGRWRPVLWIDGAFGLIVAAIFWIVVRDRPAASVDEPLSQPEPRPSNREIGDMLLAFLKSRSLWLCGLMEFLRNIGWAYLVTWLPTYLLAVKKVDPLAGGRMLTFVLGCGMVGQLVGGVFADWCVRRFGLVWGRRIPLTMAGTIAGGAYMGCIGVDAVWPVIGLCAVVSFAVDLGSPANWAFVQDVGGRVTGAAVGWTNMWGNFGASITALMVPMLLAFGKSGTHGQHYVFVVCGGSLLISGLVALGLDASKQAWRGPPRGALAV